MDVITPRGEGGDITLGFLSFFCEYCKLGEKKGESMMPTMKTTFFSCRSESPPSLPPSSYPPGRKNCENLPETERHRHARKKREQGGDAGFKWIS